MIKFLVVIMIFFMNFSICISQTSRQTHLQEGLFACRLNHFLIYEEYENSDDEYPVYTIKSIHLENNEDTVVDRGVTGKCVRFSHNEILYSKGNNIIKWNVDSGQKAIYYKIDGDTKLLGISYNSETCSLLIIEVNFKTYELFLKILNKKKEIVFHKNIDINDVEEVSSTAEEWNDYFIVTVQEKLYAIHLKNFDLNLISSKCDYYALSKNVIIYYEFVSEEKTKGYSINLNTKEKAEIDSSLEEKIFNCSNSTLFTSLVDNRFIPVYKICDQAYLWKDNRWQTTSYVLIYEDSMVVIKVPLLKKSTNEQIFEWELQSILR